MVRWSNKYTQKSETTWINQLDSHMKSIKSKKYPYHTLISSCNAQRSNPNKESHNWRKISIRIFPRCRKSPKIFKLQLTDKLIKYPSSKKVKELRKRKKKKKGKNDLLPVMSVRVDEQNNTKLNKKWYPIKRNLKTVKRENKHSFPECYLLIKNQPQKAPLPINLGINSWQFNLWALPTNRPNFNSNSDKKMMKLSNIS